MLRQDDNALNPPAPMAIPKTNKYTRSGGAAPPRRRWALVPPPIAISVLFTRSNEFGLQR